MSHPLFHPLKVRAIEPDTAEAVIVSFDVPPDLRATFGFTQGQYLTLRHTIDGQDLRRSYSICAGVDDGELRVGVRKVKGGVFSNWINSDLKPGDSLQVMCSLAEREGLRGKVQCIYFDPPYGIKFNSNFQWSTTSRDVKDGKADHITREPEQVKAFRDTWRDGIHSYLTYLRDRLTVARDLLTDSGSIFVQIGDENVHRVRAVMDEVFGKISNDNLEMVGEFFIKIKE